MGFDAFDDAVGEVVSEPGAGAGWAAVVVLDAVHDLPRRERSSLQDLADVLTGLLERRPVPGRWAPGQAVVAGLVAQVTAKAEEPEAVLPLVLGHHLLRDGTLALPFTPVGDPVADRQPPDAVLRQKQLGRDVVIGTSQDWCGNADVGGIPLPDVLPCLPQHTEPEPQL